MADLERGAAEILDELEATPLLGEGLLRAETLRAQLTRRLASRPDPGLLLRQRLHFGRLLLVLDSPDAAAFLRHLAHAARERGEAGIAHQAALLAVRACCLAGDREGAAALLASAEETADDPDARLDRLLAEAWLGTLDAVQRLEEALGRLPPTRDHDRLAALLLLADYRESGGDPTRARMALIEALSLAQRHDAPGQAGGAALLLGSLLLRTGDPRGAQAALEQALRYAEQVGDTLLQVAAGGLLVPLLMGQGAWRALLSVSERIQALAWERNNPALQASLALDRASAHLALGDPDRAVRELLRVAGALERQGENETLNVLKARLAELLPVLGPERFSALVLSTLGPGADPAAT